MKKILAILALNSTLAMAAESIDTMKPLATEIKCGMGYSFAGEKPTTTEDFILPENDMKKFTFIDPKKKIKFTALLSREKDIDGRPILGMGVLLPDGSIIGNRGFLFVDKGVLLGGQDFTNPKNKISLRVFGACKITDTSM